MLTSSSEGRFSITEQSTGHGDRISGRLEKEPKRTKSDDTAEADALKLIALGSGARRKRGAALTLPTPLTAPLELFPLQENEGRKWRILRIRRGGGGGGGGESSERCRQDATLPLGACVSTPSEGWNSLKCKIGLKRLAVFKIEFRSG
ncbi:hypothetical protein GWI33_019760 [Rhynchophorus ferrugineus]|uniref:Uncharacterized protein n=1 Tax=Rhynchophorus ferrugineus TaxID=354439 RepID=A0A834HXP3_RHYFE|nr:hypothetical protein GWI33_019760 [Rhynchophorus ferrugineus]